MMRIRISLSMVLVAVALALSGCSEDDSALIDQEFAWCTDNAPPSFDCERVFNSLQDASESGDDVKCLARVWRQLIRGAYVNTEATDAFRSCRKSLD
jgi:hypothetical protein